MIYSCLLAPTVVGEHEQKNKTVNVRNRSGVVHGEKTVEEAIAKLKHSRHPRQGMTMAHKISSCLLLWTCIMSGHAS